MNTCIFIEIKGQRAKGPFSWDTIAEAVNSVLAFKQTYSLPRCTCLIITCVSGVSQMHSPGEQKMSNQIN
jgi:hypothetical protein